MSLSPAEKMGFKWIHKLIIFTFGAKYQTPYLCLTRQKSFGMQDVVRGWNTWKKQGNSLNICENPYFYSKSGGASRIYWINIKNWTKTKQPRGFTF